MGETARSDPAVAALIARLDGEGRKRLLDPIDRISEILFGLFMVLTFTGTMSVATSGREDVRLMLIAAIGCNIAWGFVDGVMFVLRALVVRARQATLARAVRAAPGPDVARRLIGNEVGPLAEGMGAPGLESLRLWMIKQASPPTGHARMTTNDLLSALGVFLLVFLSTFPVVLPFAFIDDLQLAKRVSAAIAITMMFLCGYGWGRYGGLTPWRAGLTMVLLGLAVEFVIIALGG